MKVLMTLMICLFTTSVFSQVRFVVVCNSNTQKIEVIKSSEYADRTDAEQLGGKDFPSRAVANQWKNDNYRSDDCNSAKSGAVIAPVVPPPAAPDPAEAPDLPEKKITHIHESRVSFFGTVLFDAGDWTTPVSGGSDFVPFMAGFNFRKGNKAKFGFEASFQGWGKVDIPGDDPKMLAAATLSFLFSYPVAVDKQGRFWVVPEVGIGVDFFDLFQIDDDLNLDQKVAAPSFFLRVAMEMYHVKPFFYYGRTMIDVYDGVSLKPNHIGVGLAVTF